MKCSLKNPQYKKILWGVIYTGQGEILFCSSGQDELWFRSTGQDEIWLCSGKTVIDWSGTIRLVCLY